MNYHAVAVHSQEGSVHTEVRDQPSAIARSEGRKNLHLAIKRGNHTDTIVVIDALTQRQLEAIAYAILAHTRVEEPTNGQE